MDPALLDLLCCPLTGEPLHIGTSEDRAFFPGAGEAFLVREDGQVAYPLSDGIPRLVPDAAIPRQ